MPYFDYEDPSSFSIEGFIEELLEDLRIADEYEIYSRSIPSTFRVRFAPASTLIQDEFSPGGRNNPIDLS